MLLDPDSCSGPTLRNDKFINLALQIRSPGMYLYKLVAPDNFCIHVSSGHFGHFPCNTPSCQAFWPNKSREHDLWNFCHNSFGHCDLIPKSHHMRLASSSRYVTIKEWECWGGPVQLWGLESSSGLEGPGLERPVSSIGCCQLRWRPLGQRGKGWRVYSSGDTTWVVQCVRKKW